ncbi:MAG: [Fe-S]-binding protein [Candidatus Pelagibacter sp.]|nr:[Fe-S]-binding protein [Candidatus Pelagibacter sp.]
MKLTSKGRYAVMALTDLAIYDRMGPVSLRDVSVRQNISLMYLEQIFLKLKKNNIVKSMRGNKGGYKLNKDPNQIKLSEILLAVNENVKTVKCIKHLKKGCTGKSVKCNTHNLWDELDNHINTFFESKNLSDLTNKTRFQKRAI